MRLLQLRWHNRSTTRRKSTVSKLGSQGFIRNNPPPGDKSEGAAAVAARALRGSALLRREFESAWRKLRVASHAETTVGTDGGWHSEESVMYRRGLDPRQP